MNRLAWNQCYNKLTEEQKLLEEQYRNRVIGMGEMESVDRTHRLIEYNERRSFEDAYEDFYRKNIKGSHDIDFIGINFSANPEKPSLFKTYRHIGTVIDQFDPFLTLLDRKKMIRNYLPIITSDKNRVQYDVRLDNRQDENMTEVLSFLTDYMSSSDFFSDSSLTEIQYFSEMNITELPGYGMSSLYFLGLQWKANELTALKSHFLTRKVNDPDHFSDGFWYDDHYFLEYIKASRNSFCLRISLIAEEILRKLDGHLWMFGLDVFKSSDKKYKIYLQNPKGYDLKELLLIFTNFTELNAACVQSDQLRSWYTHHTELFLYGFAITVTSNGTYGFNLYFIPPKFLRGTT